MPILKGFGRGYFQLAGFSKGSGTFICIERELVRLSRASEQKFSNNNN